jgi:predicted RNase H-like nuclease (RuvC/YqgF family)
MPLTQSQRNQIANYKVRIESVRKDLQRLKDDKKRKSEHYASLIKNTKDQNCKRSYRQSKITAINSIVNQMESKKKEIERLKENINNIKR